MDINNLCNFFFVGIVTDVNPAEGTVIVTRPDKNDRTTAALKVIQRGTCKTKDYWMPAVNDQVLCLVLPNVSGKGPGEGYVLGAFYSDADKALESNEVVRSVHHESGSYWRVDENGNMEIHASGSMKLTAPMIYIN